MMLPPRIRAFVRTLVAFFLVVGMALAPPLNVLAHGSAALAVEGGRHVALALGETPHDHGHSHDDDEPAPHKRSGHLHGHDASDHNHDTGTPVRLRAGDRVPLPRQFGLTPEPPPDPGPTFRLDRPPRLPS
jgi:hypothetical protein